MNTFCLLILTLALGLPLATNARGRVLDPQNLRLKKMISLNHQNLPVSGKGVLTAVIDSGVSFTVPALRKNLIPGWNFIADNNTMIDYSGHGTPVAGIITVIAPEVTLLPLVAFGESGTTDDIVDATIYAINRRASVINISMTYTEEMLRKVRNAVGNRKFKQSLLVISAGNWSTRYPDFYAHWDNVLVVGATGLDFPIRSTSYSAYGENVDIAAPSGDANDGIATYSAYISDPYLFNGTSGAAPVVSGAAALLKEKYPKARGSDLKKMILEKSCYSKNISVSKGRLLNIGRLFDTSTKCPYSLK